LLPLLAIAAALPDPGVEWHAVEARRWRAEDRPYATYLDRVGRELLDAGAAGADPYASRRGMFHRAMRSPFAPDGLRPYGMYVPRSYDASRPWPLLVLLHGAGSDYMATLRIAMGMTRMRGESKAMAARRIPPPGALPDLPALVVTPTGYGNTDFRFAGEREVLEVVDDVRAHYAVDDDRIWLAGISRGGWGAIQLGLRHAGRFAAIVDVCGFVDPFVGRPGSEHRWDPAVRRYESLLLAARPIASVERARGTEVVLIHGARDPGTAIEGPDRFARRLGELGLRHRALQYPGGHHHVWMPTFKEGYLYRLLAEIRRDPPDRVSLVAFGYEDGESRWVRVEQIRRHGLPAKIDARREGDRVVVTTENVERFSLSIPSADPIHLLVDGEVAWRGTPSDRVVLARDRVGWSEWNGEAPAPG
jgi:poly(3-hydroxybutyrate) depolymerase